MSTGSTYLEPSSKRIHLDQGLRWWKKLHKSAFHTCPGGSLSGEPYPHSASIISLYSCELSSFYDTEPLAMSKEGFPHGSNALVDILAFRFQHWWIRLYRFYLSMREDVNKKKKTKLSKTRRRVGLIESCFNTLLGGLSWKEYWSEKIWLQSPLQLSKFCLKPPSKKRILNYLPWLKKNCWESNTDALACYGHLFGSESTFCPS